MTDFSNNDQKVSTPRPIGRGKGIGLLIHLWWAQKRRTFRWMDVFVGCYFGFLFLLIGFIVYMEMGDQLDEVKGQMPMGGVMIILAATLLISDLIFKYMFMNDSVLMDDFLKTKPICQRDWNRFIVISCFINGWNLMLPFIMGIFAFVLMGVGEALMAIVMFFVMSAMNSMLLANIRKSDGWELKLPMLFALFFYIIFAIIYVVVASSLSTVMMMLVFTLITLVGIYTLYIYFSHLVRYDEHKARVSRAHSLGGVSLFSMEYISLLRSKRLRVSVLILPLCMLPSAYNPAIVDEISVMSYVVCLFVIWAPSLMLSQWIFGTEANFFQGLITKPVSIRQLLINKYYFYALLSMAGALLLVPGIWLVNLNPWFILSGFVFVAGICSLMMFPTCLFSTRIDLFSSAFFNYQGANKGINIYSLIIFLPMVLVGVLIAFTSLQVTALVMFALGLLGVALHRWVITRLANIFMQRRYRRLEAYMNN